MSQKPTTDPDLRSLLETTGDGPKVSLCMTTHPGVTDHEEDMIRYKNLIDQAIDGLKSHGMGEGDAERFLGELVAKKNDAQFWNGVSHGLSIHTDGQTTRIFRLSQPVDQSVSVGDQYNVRHVALSTSRADTLDMLLVSMEAARVMRATIAAGEIKSLEPIKTSKFPLTYEDVITARDPEVQLQHHSGASPQGVHTGRTPIFHGQGEGESKREADHLNYLKQVAHAVRDCHDVDGRRLVVMADESIAGTLVSELDDAPVEVLQVAPDRETPDKLVKRLQPIAKDFADEQAAQLAERFGTASSRQQGSNQIPELCDAVRAAKIDTLMVHPTAAAHGRFNGDDLCMTDAGESGACDLVNWLIQKTVASGGTIVRCDDASVLGDSPVAAIYRY